MGRILVIDGYPRIRELLRDILELGGHEVTCAADGVEGMEQYRKEKHDLVKTDVFMSEKSGLETILELREEFPQVRIIAMTGWDSPKEFDVVDMTKRHGADEAIKVPGCPEQSRGDASALGTERFEIR